VALHLITQIWHVCFSLNTECICSKFRYSLYIFSMCCCYTNFDILGLTWVFGFLAINDARLPFQYLFCITNSFQGLVIFLLHNIRDPKVLAWWRTTVFRLKPLPPAHSGSTSSSAYLKKSSTTTSVSDCSNYLQPPPIKNHKNPELNKNSLKPNSGPTRKVLEQSKLIYSSTESESSGYNTSNV